MKGEKFHYNQANLVQFATGMNGDEDLGQDITMKGEKFHYNQQWRTIQSDLTWKRNLEMKKEAFCLSMLG